jgi:hypothetical protein
MERYRKTRGEINLFNIPTTTAIYTVKKVNEFPSPAWLVTSQVGDVKIANLFFTVYRELFSSILERSGSASSLILVRRGREASKEYKRC